MSIFKPFTARNDLAKGKPELNCDLKVITTMSRNLFMHSKTTDQLRLINANLLIYSDFMSFK